MRLLRRMAGAAALCLVAVGAWGETPQGLLDRYRQRAMAADLAFEDFSVERGYTLYRDKHPIMGVGAVNCASCHRKDPREQIRAHRTDILCRACHVINDEEHPDPQSAKKRVIEPFTPGANPKRFTDFEVVERFFKTNCQLLLKRECTAREKGDLITYLLSVEGPAIEAPDPAAALREQAQQSQ
jgi:hypothetical protein